MIEAGRTADGRVVHALRLTGGGLSLRLLTLGATVQDLRLAGVDWPLVLGARDPAHYAGPLVYAGAVVGPVANRIAGARAVIAGIPCNFAANEGRTLLHSGTRGLHARIWTVEDAGPDHATLRTDLSAGEDGFPGNRTFRARFRVSAPATLTMDLTATTDAVTLVNLAHHGYWNLDGSADTAGHRLTIAADHYLDVDGAMIPTGPPRSVVGTPYDFRKSRPLSAAPPLDHNFCVAAARRDLAEVATLTGASGIQLRIATTEPGLQVYDGRHFAVPRGAGLDGRAYGPCAGIAFEPQVWPDAPNRPDFPSTTLAPGETSCQTTRFMLDRVRMP